MSIPFSRSMRSINNDGLRLPLAGLLAALLIISAWLVWFFSARLPQVETSRQFSANRDGTLSVTFSPAVVARVQPGQKAELHLAGAAAPQEAVVADVEPQRKTGQVKVYLVSGDKPDEGAQGTVQIQVGELTPLELLVQALGKAPKNNVPQIQ